MTNEKIIAAIFIMSAVTVSTRLLPFLIFKGQGKPSPLIEYLGKYLPPAIICGIIVYCFKDVNFTKEFYGLPEALAVSVVLFLHYKFKNSMISIFCGTALYMLLVQFVFI